MRKLSGLLALTAWYACSALHAQTTTTLPTVKVDARYEEKYGGYLVSGDFKVDQRMPSVVFPAEALVKDDILSIQPLHLQDNEYLVLQECAVADCSQAALVRVWNAFGATNSTIHDTENRVWIRHENKYFIWLKRLPSLTCQACTVYSSFESVSPPMTLYPQGDLAQEAKTDLAEHENDDPIPVKSQTHEGSTFVVTYASGSVVRIRRMHAAE